MLFINFKSYIEATGEKALSLATACRDVSKKYKRAIVPVVQTADLYKIKQSLDIPVWVQHIDNVFGQATGFTSLEAVAINGASGAILNHSEHKLAPGTLAQTLSRVKFYNQKEKEEKFESLVCCRSLGQAERLIKLKPDYLAYEPPELIGGEISVSMAQPESIKHFVEICGQTPAIIGAGIKNSLDVKIGLGLGAKGFLVSSAVILAKDPQKTLVELISQF